MGRSSRRVHQRLGIAALKDHLEERLASGQKPTVDSSTLAAVADTVGEGGESFSRLLATAYAGISLKVGDHDVMPTLARAATSPELLKHSRLRFLLAGIAVLNAFDR